MRIQNYQEAIQNIKDEDFLSDEEMAEQTGLSVTAIKKILNGDTENIQRATIRKIAEGTGRKFRIEDDRIIFYKPETVDLKGSIVSQSSLIAKITKDEDLSPGLKALKENDELRESLNITDKAIEILATTRLRTDNDQKLDQDFWVQLLLLYRSRGLNV